MDESTRRAQRLTRAASLVLMTLGLLHIVLFTAVAIWRGYGSDWLAGNLRTLSFVTTFSTEPSNASFWASIGSAAVPLFLLGGLLLRLSKLGVAVPGSIGYGLAVWFLIAAVLFEPTGFSVALVAAIMVIRAHILERGARSAVVPATPVSENF